MTDRIIERGDRNAVAGLIPLLLCVQAGTAEPVEWPTAPYVDQRFREGRLANHEYSGRGAVPEVDATEVALRGIRRGIDNVDHVGQTLAVHPGSPVRLPYIWLP